MSPLRIGLASAIFASACFVFTDLNINRNRQSKILDEYGVSDIQVLIMPNSSWTRKLTVKDSTTIQEEVLRPSQTLSLYKDQVEMNVGEAISVSEFEVDSYQNFPDRLIGESLSDDDIFYSINSDRKQLQVGDFLNPDEPEILQPKKISTEERNIGLFIDVDSTEMDGQVNSPQSIGPNMFMDTSLELTP